MRLALKSGQRRRMACTPRHGHRLAQDTTGATLIEFALVAPIFLILLLGTLEFGIVLYLRGAVEEVTRSAARFAITGNTDPADPDVSRDEYLKTRLKTTIKEIVFIPDNVTVSSEIYSDYSSATADAGSSTTGEDTRFGGSGEIMRYTVEYNHEFITPIPKLVNTLSNNLRIQSTVFVRNENY